MCDRMAAAMALVLVAMAAAAPLASAKCDATDCGTCITQKWEFDLRHW